MPNSRPKDEVDDGGERRRRGWQERVVSWGHMSIALACMAGATLAWTWNVSRDYAAATAAAERRLTQLEERYLQLVERNNQQDQQVAGMLQTRNTQIKSMEDKLDRLITEMTQLKVTTATIQVQLQRGR